MKKVIYLILALSMLFPFCGCNHQKENAVKIGAIIPETGNLAGLGNTIRSGLTLAVQELNEKSPNVHYELYFEDTSSEQRNVISAYYKLKQKGVKCFVSTTSAACKALKSKIIDDSNLIFCICSLPELTADGAWNIFKLGNSSLEESEAITNFLFSNSIDSISLFYPNSEYGNSFMNAFYDSGVNIRTSIAYDENGTDFNSIVAKGIDKKTQYVATIGYSSSLGQVINTIRKIRPDISIISNLGFTNSDVFNIVGKDNLDITYIDYSIPESEATKQKEKYMHNNFNTSFSSTCYLAYMIPHFIDWGIHQNDISAQELPELSKALRSICTITIDDSYTFSVYSNGDITPNLILKKYE